jgi:hypothetical protein
MQKFEIKIDGSFPTGSVIFAACNDSYFREHGGALIHSADDIGKDIHFHVCNPTKETKDLQEKIINNTKVNVSFTSHNIEVDSGPLSEELKWQAPNLSTRRKCHVYYACMRFFLARKILEVADRVLIVDTDSVFMNDFEWPKENYGFYPRPGSPPHRATAAGVVYFQKPALETLHLLEEKIYSLPWEWGVDQESLGYYFNDVVKEWSYLFDKTFLDWNFLENTVLWTGKGDQKRWNKKYVETKNKFDRTQGCINSIVQYKEQQI